MGAIYLSALVLGLGTLLLQFVMSHVGGDADGGADHAVGEGHDELVVHADGETGAHGLENPLGVFLSMRFWTFSLFGFGMVGAPLHYLHLVGPLASLLMAVATGLLSGLGVALVHRWLQGSVSSMTTQTDTVGKAARVTVPMAKGQLGKVRVDVKGKRVDLLATSDSESLLAGEEVVVVGYEGDRVRVEPLKLRD